MQIWNWFYTPHRAALLTFHSTLESWWTRESRQLVCGRACSLRRPSVSHLHEFSSLVWKVDPLASLWPVRTPQAIISAAGKPTISPDGITRTATFRRTCHSQICSRSEPNSPVFDDCRSLWVWAASIGFFHSFPSIHSKFLNQREHMSLVYEWFGSDCRCNQVSVSTTFTSTNETIPV